MNALLTLIPFIFVRIVLFKWMNKEAYSRAQKFAPLEENKKMYLIVYQLSQLLLIILPAFYQVTINLRIDIFSIILYILGLIIIVFSIYGFAESKPQSLIQSGIYRYSRHPMYVGYFIFYLGLGWWMESYLYLVILLLFQIATHQIILSEERMCRENFGQEYIEYMSKVRRYL